MPDLEFLPQWYTQLQRRRRMLMLQIWLTLAAAVAGAMWLGLAQRNVRMVSAGLVSLDGQLSHTNSQLQHMDRLEILRRQWRQQVEVLRKLGTHVESSRLIGTLAGIIPQNVALLGFELDTEEKPVPLSNAARAALKDPNNLPMDRRLKVKLHGIAPTDVELATLLTELNRVPFFENVAPTYSRDRKDSGHIQREFEVIFTINLNTTSGS